MQILVRVFAAPVGAFLPGRKGPGKRRVFSNDLYLVSIDGNPQPAHTRAGSLSGFTTTLRIAKANDNLYPAGSYLIQYEAAYRFNTVPGALQRGQVIARGVLHGNVGSSGFTPSTGKPRLRSLVERRPTPRLADR
jgi:hypothetical protein